LFLYSLIQSNFDNNDDISIVRDLYLLQHEKSYTQEEFQKMVSHYKGKSVTNWHIAEQLRKDHGFRIVPSAQL